MASQPFKRAFELQVQHRGGWNAILDRIRSGETITNIAKDYGCSRPWLARMLNKPERRESLAAVKKEAGEAHAERATEIADTVPESRDAVAKARLQVDTHRWMAGIRDREQFGEQAAPSLTLNVQELHLAALRHRITDASRPLLPPPSSSTEDDDDGDGSVPTLAGV